MHQRRQEREKLARQKQKKKEEATVSRLALLQLKKELQQVTKDTPKQNRGSPSKKKVTIVIKSNNKEEVLETPRLRTRRKINTPKWLDDYILE